MATLVFSGGLNEQDVALVRPEECIEGYNSELGFNQTSFRPRKPFDKMGTATNASEIRGIVQLVKRDATETTLIQAGDTVYDWDGDSSFTSKGTVNSASKLRGTTWSLDDYSIITDLEKNTVVKKWDGSTLSTLTTGIEPVDLYAKYSIVHLGRVWMFNITAGTDTPHLLIGSAFEDPTSYDTSLRAKDSSFTTGNEAFYMVSPDLLPINGVELWQGILIMSTDGGRLWKLTGTDSTDFVWVPFYTGSFAAGEETMASIGNDVVYMKRDGVIESLVGTDRFGDVSANDLSKWIRTTSAGASDSITIYDQSRQKVYFFAGSNKLLVLFKDLLGTELSPWMVYKTDHASSFSTTAAAYIREAGGNSASDHYVYYGDDSGNIYRLDGTGSGDNGDTDVETTRKTGFIQRVESEDGEMVKVKRDRLRGRVYYRRISSVDLLMDFEWADDYATNRCTVPLEGPQANDAAAHFNASAYFGGSFYFNTGFALSFKTSTKGFSAIGRGPGVYVLTSITSSQDFDVLKVEI